MANDKKSKKKAGKGRARSASGYKSARAPKMRQMAREKDAAGAKRSAAKTPSAPASLDAGPHLDPAPFEDLGEEAVVTIVERDTTPAGSAPTPSLTARLSEVGAAPRSTRADAYLPYQGPVEEAVVEIVEVERSAASLSGLARRRFLPGLHWFFKPRDGTGG